VFRREFLHIANIEVFQESITIASACKKVLRKRFLKPYTIGIIPAGGYTGDVKYSKKAIMWLLYKERLDEIKILQSRNGREYRLPELPRLSVKGIGIFRLFLAWTYLSTFPRRPHHVRRHLIAQVRTDAGANKAN
jgi:hypothetical protein